MAATRTSMEALIRRALMIWPTRPGQAVFRAQEAALVMGDISGLTGRSLDLACGSGKFAALIDTTFDMGVDMSFRRIQQAHQQGKYRNLIQGDLLRLPFQDHSFEAALCNSTIEHLAEAQPAINEAYRVLASDGRLILSIPAPAKRSRYFFAKLARSKYQSPQVAEQLRTAFDTRYDHRRYLSRDGLASLLTAAGFKEIRITEYEGERASELIDVLCNVQVAMRSMGDPVFDRIICEGTSEYMAKMFAPILKQAPVPGEGAGLYCVAVK